MSWASRRQFLYLTGFLLFVALTFLFIFWGTIFKKPTCMDGKQNGTELGVDCGGICQKMCRSQVSDPIVLWSRAFKVAGSSYNLLAYIENQNKDSAAYLAPYEFRVYDESGLVIDTRRGKVSIPPNQRFAIFEARIDAGNSTPRSVSFDFTEPLVWYKKMPKIQTEPVKIERILLSDNDGAPVLTASVVNDSIYNLPEFDVIAIVYDQNRNAIGVSSTHKYGLSSNQKTDVVFTWPEPFSDFAVFQDLIISVDPFTLPF
jgi:hypothetical protein